MNKQKQKTLITFWSINALILIIVSTITIITIIILEVLADIDSKGSCESNGLQSIKFYLSKYAEQHNGLLSLEKVKTIIQKKYPGLLICKHANQPYIWEKGQYNIYTVRIRPIIYCPKPHGIIRKWRVVLFSNLELKRVPESEFQFMIKQETESKFGKK